ncbi:MAG: hypothetical protein NC093_03425 [Alistipes sp.]|nr:hypothetical protein [Alistipes sp.]
MKKIIALLFVTIFALAGCGKESGEQVGFSLNDSSDENLVAVEEKITLSSEMEEYLKRKAPLYNLEKDSGVVRQAQCRRNAYESIRESDIFDTSDLTYVGKSHQDGFYHYYLPEPLYYDLYLNTDGRAFYFDKDGRFRKFFNRDAISDDICESRDNREAAAKAAVGHEAEMMKISLEAAEASTDIVSDMEVSEYSPYLYIVTGKNPEGKEVFVEMDFSNSFQLRIMDVTYYEPEENVDVDYYKAQIDEYIAEEVDSKAGSYDAITDYSYEVKYEVVDGEIYAMANFTFCTNDYEYAEVACFG